MDLRGTLFIIFISFVAILFGNQRFLVMEYINDVTTLEMLPSMITCICWTDLIFFHRPRGHHYHHYRHHDHHHGEKKGIESICDDFPPDFPPPETNTTSTICVDRNGCCNFTTVQAAVDAVGTLSAKRTIIWINSGIYL